MAVVCLAGAGCVQRRMTIRSNPPGALVYVDNYEIGTTPVSTDYTYYGTRKIQLVKDGYETLTAKKWIAPPWYEIFPLDFFSENIVPWEIRDERALEFAMQPQAPSPPEQLLGRAENLRLSSHQEGIAVPATPKPPTGVVLPQATIVGPR